MHHVHLGTKLQYTYASARFGMRPLGYNLHYQTNGGPMNQNMSQPLYLCMQQKRVKLSLARPTLLINGTYAELLSVQLRHQHYWIYFVIQMLFSQNTYQTPFYAIYKFKQPSSWKHGQYGLLSPAPWLLDLHFSEAIMSSHVRWRISAFCLFLGTRPSVRVHMGTVLDERTAPDMV